MVIGRGCHRKHPKGTSEVVTWLSITTGVAQLLVMHAHTQGNPEGVKFPSHPVDILLLLRKKRGGKRACAEPTSGQFLFRSRDFVTSVKRSPLRRILSNFRLLMRRTYFRTGHLTDITSGDVTSGHITSGCSSSLLRKCGFVVLIYYYYMC